MPTATLTIANLTDLQTDQLNRDTALVRHAVLRISADSKPRRDHAEVLSKIMIEAHARAKG